MQELQEKSCQIQSLLDKEDLVNHKRTHATNMEDLTRIELLLEKAVQQEPAQKGDKQSEPSVTGMSRRSHASSQRSSVASKVSPLRLEHKQKQAELMAKQRLLEEKRKLEQRKQELEWEEQQFKLKMEYAINQEKMEVLERFGEEDAAVTEVKGDKKESCTNTKDRDQEKEEMAVKTQENEDRKLKTAKRCHDGPVGTRATERSEEVKGTQVEPNIQQQEKQRNKPFFVFPY